MSEITFIEEGRVYTELQLPPDGKIFPNGADAWVWDNNLDLRERLKVFVIYPQRMGNLIRCCTKYALFRHMALISDGRPLIPCPTIEDAKRGCLVQMDTSAGHFNFILDNYSQDSKGKVYVKILGRNVYFKSLRRLCFMDEMEKKKNVCKKI